MIGQGFLASPFLQNWMASAIKLPAPKGPFPVGTKDFTLTHPVLTFEDGSPRKIGVKAWYPAESTDAVYEPYFSDEMMAGLHAGTGPNHFAYLSRVKTHSKKDAGFSREVSKCPVLFFSHGHGLSNRTNTLVCEQLASQGYVVFAIGHTGEGFCTLIDGVAVGYDKKVMSILQEEGKTFFEGHTGINIKNHAPQYIRLMIEEEREMAKRVAIWTADLRLAADWVDEDGDDFFHGHLAAGKYGVFGHSIGGAVSLRALLEDERFVCGVNMDGGQFGGDYLDRKAEKPVMVISGNIAGLRTGYHPDQKGVYWVTIPGSNHLYYSDGMLVYGFFPALMGQGAGIKGKRMLVVLGSLLVCFFDRYLCGKTVDVADVARSLKEVKYLYETKEVDR